MPWVTNWWFSRTSSVIDQVRAEVGVRAVKEPETDNEAYNTSQERPEAKGIVSHRKDW